MCGVRRDRADTLGQHPSSRRYYPIDSIDGEQGFPIRTSSGSHAEVYVHLMVFGERPLDRHTDPPSEDSTRF